MGLEDEVAPEAAGPGAGAVGSGFRPISTTGNAELDESIGSRVAFETLRLLEEQAKLKADMEHKMATLEDGLRKALKKAEDAEGESQKRITVLEGQIKNMVRRRACAGR